MTAVFITIAMAANLAPPKIVTTNYCIAGSDTIVAEEMHVQLVTHDQRLKTNVQVQAPSNPTNASNITMCSTSDHKLCCNCVEQLDSGAMLMLRKLTQDSTSNTSCKTLFDAFKKAEQYTNLFIDTTMIDICTNKFNSNITAFDAWINSGPNNAPVSACAKLKICDTLPGDRTGDVEIFNFSTSPAKILPGQPVNVALIYKSKEGCNPGKIVLDVEHESGFRARWGVKMLDESKKAFETFSSWTIDTKVVPTDMNSPTSESNFTEWYRCDGSTTDATLCWPAGDYTVKATIYNMDISATSANVYATNSTVFNLQESFERPFATPVAGETPCYGDQTPIAFREVKGNFCSPSCSFKNKKKPDVACPPVPAYLHAEAQSLCSLERQGSKGASNCAMMCTLPPNNKDPNTDKTKCTNPPCLCPAGAFCTAVSGAPKPFTGTCIYYPV